MVQMIGSLQEKTTELRRQHILDAAAEVFSERGFSRASIRDIATVAGVADGTIYNVFENKDALLMALLDALAPPPDEAIVSPQLIESDPELFLKQILEQRWKAYTPRTMQILRVAISQALIDEVVRVKLFEVFIQQALKGAESLVGPLFQGGDENVNRLQTTPRLIVASLIGLNILVLLDDEQDQASHAAMVGPLAEMLWSGLGKSGEPSLGK